MGFLAKKLCTVKSDNRRFQNTAGQAKIFYWFSKSIDLYGSIRDISCTARVIWVTRLSFLATALFWNPPIIAWHLRPHGTHCKLCEFLFKPRKVTPPIFWKVCRSGKLSSKSWEKLPLLLRVLIYLHKYRTTAFFPQWHLDWGIC